MAAVVFASLLASAPGPPVPVKLGRRAVLLPPGTTIGALVLGAGIEVRTGALLDVEGRVLRRGAFPGRITLNGEEVRATRVLRPGDVVEVVHGRNRTERLVRDVVEVPEGVIPNPQTHVGTVPGERVITMGEESGKVVSSEFRPSGDARAPRQVALTFDDGPSPTFTRRIVRTLLRLDAPATFFMIGYLAERHPDVVAKVLDGGFAIGNHSLRHPMDRPFESLHPDRMLEEVGGGHAALRRANVEPELFRPPGGSWSRETVDLASDVGERTVLWSVDSQDFRPQKPRMLAARVVRDAGPGSIVLLHDGGGNRSATVRALPRIVNGLRRKGLELVALG